MQSKRIGKTLLAMFVTIVMSVTIFQTPTFAKKVQHTKEQSTEYMESKRKISFDNLDLSYDKKTKEISIDISNNLSKDDKLKAEECAYELEFMLERYDSNFNDFLIKSIKESDAADTELMGISFTECPLEKNDAGCLDRVEKTVGKNKNHEILKKAAAKDLTESSDPNEKDKTYFALVTSLYRNNKKNSNGMYKYVCSTLATWSKNSFLSGSNYPAGGNDYIIQTVPKKFTVMSDNLTMNYNKGLTAVKGTHFWRSNVTDRAIKYDIVDDPWGENQMTKALLQTTCRSKASSDYRRIYSYYVHTWKQMSLKVSVGVDTTKALSLQITPEVASKQWQVADYVVFDF